MAILIACSAHAAAAQDPAALLPDSLSEQAQFSLITIKPSDPVYTIFGHSALRLYDPAHRLDISFNYGTFDFGNPVVFVGTFAYGKLDYMLSINDFQRAARYYWQYEHRPMIEQMLRLDAPQREALYQFLKKNALPENKYYRYDFFFDNCSTRLRDVLAVTLGDDLRFAAEPDPGLSFRELIDPYLVEQRFLDLGMDLGLGLPADRIATAQETTFLPDYLAAAFDHARVRVDSTWQPLVASTDTLAWSEETATLDPTLPWPSILAWLLFGLALLATARTYRKPYVRRHWLDALLFTIAGLAGLLIVFLWFISLHNVTAANFNLLWAWPTHFVIAILVLRASPPSWLRYYLLATAATTLIVVAGWPIWPQELPMAMLPLLLLIVLRSMALAYSLRHTETHTSSVSTSAA